MNMERRLTERKRRKCTKNRSNACIRVLLGRQACRHTRRRFWGFATREVLVLVLSVLSFFVPFITFHFFVCLHFYLGEAAL